MSIIPSKRPVLVGELAAEFAGTMILILLGCGVVAQVVDQAAQQVQRTLHPPVAGLEHVEGLVIAGRKAGGSGQQGGHVGILRAGGRCRCVRI